MKHIALKHIQGLLCLFLLMNIEAVGQTNEIDSLVLAEAYSTYWETSNINSKRKASRNILKLKPGFNQVFQKLQQGGSYNKQSPTGFFEWYNKVDGKKLNSLVFIPFNYDPTKKYPVLFFLHGGVLLVDKSSKVRHVDVNDKRYQSREYITVYPYAYDEAPWWSDVQMTHILKILRELKHRYNVNENEVYLEGVSDGGTGSFYLANYNSTYWASFVSLIGNISGLKGLASKQTYVSNLRNKPFFIINTEDDHMFNSAHILLYTHLLNKAQLNMKFSMLKKEGHDLTWYPQYKDSIQAFLDKNVRNPYPNKIYWESEFEANSNRHHWLVLNKLGTASSESIIEDINRLPNLAPMFKRDSVSGRVEIEKTKNIVNVKTRGVLQYTLLLSPESFDFDQPIKVITNNRVSFEGIVEGDLKTLFKWAIIDNDRTMLFAKELVINVDQTAKHRK